MKKTLGAPVTTTDLVLSPAVVAGLHGTILGWYARNARSLPWRHTRDPYAILVSEVMLQQTQVSRVVPRFPRFLRRFPDLETLAAATLAEVLEEWPGLGYNNRAVRLRRCAQTVVALPAPHTGPPSPPAKRRQAAGPCRPHAALPATLEGLAALPGLGPYTARAVLIFAHNADLAAVDANVRRVLTHELRLPHDLPASRLQAVADAVLPLGRSRDWHNALMDYGALELTGRATGIAGLTRQGPFTGSRRWWRSRIVRTLLAAGPSTVTTLQRDLALDREHLEELLTALERDGIVERAAELVRLP